MDSIRRRKATILIAVLSFILIVLVLGAGAEPSGFHGYKIRSAEDIPPFLQALGWECDPSALSEQKAVLPKQFDETFIAYNAIQLQQGCDLSAYAGKEVTVYTLPILNYPDETETVLATVIVYKNHIIGGDLHAAAMDGFMLPLKT